jgi:hypothetical protein
VPDSFTRASHTHGEGEEGKVAEAVGVLLHDSLVHADTGVVVDITRLGETHNRVDEDVSLALAGSTDGELTVSTVHGVASLESDDLPPGELLEVGSEFGGCISEGDVVEVGGCLDGLDLATDVELLDAVAEVGDGGVGRVVGAEDFDSLVYTVGLVDVVNRDDSERLVVTRVPEGNASAWDDFEVVDVLLGDVQVDRDGEQDAVGETEVFDDTNSMLAVSLVRY